MGIKTLLLIERDERLAQEIRWYFEVDGFRVRHAASADEALALADRSSPDIVILDRMIEGPRGFGMCARLKRNSAKPNLPVLVLAASGMESYVAEALEDGADDCVTKPVNMRELIARVAALIRRTNPVLAGVTLTFHDLEMDLAGFKVRRGGKLIPLSPTEFQILRQFLHSPRKAFSREQMIKLLWTKDEEVDLRTIDTYVRHIRNSLNKGGRKDLIRTVRAVGYALDAD